VIGPEGLDKLFTVLLESPGALRRPEGIQEFARRLHR